MQLKEIFCLLNQKRLKREKNKAHTQKKNKKTVKAPGYRVNLFLEVAQLLFNGNIWVKKVEVIKQVQTLENI